MLFQDSDVAKWLEAGVAYYEATGKMRLQSLETRLSAYIMQTASDGEFRETLTEVALMLGCSYRHLLRSLNKLCQQGVLSKEESGYHVVNSTRLAELAGDLYVLRVGDKC